MADFIAFKLQHPDAGRVTVRYGTKTADGKFQCTQPNQEFKTDEQALLSIELWNNQ